MITVIGAGIYGALTSLKLAEAGYEVKLFDGLGILQGSTKHNMWRLHNGYQYPSKKCMDKSHKTYQKFIDMFPAAITNTKTYYVIAADSNTSAESYVNYMESSGLPYEVTDLPIIKVNNCQTLDGQPAIFLVDEVTYDPMKLQSIIEQQIMNNSRISFINKYISLEETEGIVVNTVPDTEKKCYEIIYGFLPEKYRNMCVVIMDGPFMTINAFGDTGMHAIYHVTLSETISDLLNGDIAPAPGPGPEGWKWKQIVKACTDYFVDFDFTYVGSTFTQKLTNPACPNCRHGYIKKEGSVINCYPGKIGEAVYLSDRIVKTLSDQ